MPDDFITLDELAAYLSPRAPRDLDGDVLAEVAVASACATIRTLAEQELTFVEDDTATFSVGESRKVLLMPELPVGTIDEVRIDDEVSLDWQLRRGGILVSTDGDFGPDVTVEVDYSHGYVYDASASEFPPELRLLALTLAARAYQQGISKQESTGNSSVTWSVASAQDLSVGEKAIVTKYRAHGDGREVEAVPATS